jgi:Fic family protein
MKASDFTAPSAGQLVDIGQGFHAFVPSNLHRGHSVPARLTRLLGETRSKLGRLNEGVSSLQNPDLFLRAFQKREAVLSSRIEGTVTTLDDAFLSEAVGPEERVQHATLEAQRQQEKRIDDAHEVRNYERALRSGVDALQTGRSLNVSLLKELHRQLLDGVRGEDKRPGEVREKQVFVANRTVHLPDDARFVPPPALQLPDCLDDFDRYLSEHESDEALIRIALAHYQFETIHPFSDGNGRTGRLLIALQMVSERVLDRPVLYVSPSLERQRQAYYDGLLRVSQRATYLEWAEFFVRAVASSADETLQRLGQLRDLFESFTARLKDKQTQRPLQLAKQLLAMPYVTVPMVKRALDWPTGTAQNTIATLVEEGILSESTRISLGKGRPTTIYRCSEVLSIVRE